MIDGSDNSRACTLRCGGRGFRRGECISGGAGAGKVQVACVYSAGVRLLVLWSGGDGVGVGKGEG